MELNVQLALAQLLRCNERDKPPRKPSGMMTYEKFLVLSDSRRIFYNAARLKLTKMEYEILRYLIENHDFPLSLTPMNYWQSKGLPRGGLKTAQCPSKWNVPFGQGHFHYCFMHQALHRLLTGGIQRTGGNSTFTVTGLNGFFYKLLFINPDNRSDRPFHHSRYSIVPAGKIQLPAHRLLW